MTQEDVLVYIEAILKSFNFHIEKELDGTMARAGKITTPHGDILTPAFVPVGTKATVKGVTPEELEAVGAQVVLANTYHLYLQPGDELVRDMGGLGKFMHWQGPTMTDSGGFQVFSLGAAYGKELSKVTKITDPDYLIPERSMDPEAAPLAKIGADGVVFKSHLDGSVHYFSPERSIEIQHNIGADIIFAFDECTSPAHDRKYQEEALDRTHRWAKKSLEHHHKLLANTSSQPSPAEGKESDPTPSPLQERAGVRFSPVALFGVIQGGRDEELRKRSAKEISEMKSESGKEFDGFGIGGSFAKEDMATAVKWCNEILPKEKPRHLLGIGEPEDLFMGVEQGVDLFDCVGPTRIGRNGQAITHIGKLNMMNAEFVTDHAPLDSECGCSVCKHYTRAYISHLFRAKEMLGSVLVTQHNLYFTLNLVSKMREAILNGTFMELKDTFLAKYNQKSTIK